MIKWIDINMLTPQPDFEVIVASDDDVTCAIFREDDSGFWFDGTSISPTHWMPLPEPPEEAQ